MRETTGRIIPSTSELLHLGLKHQSTPFEPCALLPLELERPIASTQALATLLP